MLVFVGFLLVGLGEFNRDSSTVSFVGWVQRMKDVLVLCGWDEDWSFDLHHFLPFCLVTDLQDRISQGPFSGRQKAWTFLHTPEDSHLEAHIGV